MLRDGQEVGGDLLNLKLPLLDDWWEGAAPCADGRVVA
jgi:hypothetical protein